MTTNQIANRLVELCRKGEFETAQKELFADEAISIEPSASPAFEKETKGLPAIIEKGHKFNSMVDAMHKLEVSEPMVATTAFACSLIAAAAYSIVSVLNTTGGAPLIIT